MIKKILFIVLMLIFTSIIGWTQYLNIDESIFMLPYTHYYSNEGLFNRSSFDIEFNEIDLNDPFTGEFFVIPSRLFYKEINLEFIDNKKSINIISNTDESITLFRDGFSLKRKSNSNVVNQLFFSKNFNNFNFGIAVSNYGNTFYHFDNRFVGLSGQGFLNYNNQKISIKSYFYYSQDNYSNYAFDDTENSNIITFNENAMADRKKYFLGLNINYNIFENLFIKLNINNGNENIKGENLNESYFDTEENLWKDNYFRNLKKDFLKTDFRVYYEKQINKFIISPYLLISANNYKYNKEYNPYGVIIGNYYKILNYEFNSKILLNKYNLGLILFYNKKMQEGLYFKSNLNYVLYKYSIEDLKIDLKSLNLFSRIGFKKNNFNAFLNLNHFSKPLNLNKLLYLSNGFSPFTIQEIGDENSNNNIIIEPVKYNYFESESFNKYLNINLNFELTLNNYKLSSSLVYNKYNKFWDSFNLNDKIYIGEVIKDDKDILFNPQIEFIGANINLNYKSNNLKYLAGFSYLSTKGNYNNYFYSYFNSDSYLSFLFLNTDSQENFGKTWYSSSFGNGIKFYFKGEYKINNKITSILYFVHFPRINFYLMNLENGEIIINNSVKQTTTLNYLSLILSYKFKKFNIYLGVKNILNSTPETFINAFDQNILNKFDTFSTFIMVKYYLD